MISCAGIARRDLQAGLDAGDVAARQQGVLQLTHQAADHPAVNLLEIHADLAPGVNAPRERASAKLGDVLRSLVVHVYLSGTN
jgi:hypothetical protein